MASINPYLNFDGNTEEVFDFYKSVFGGEFISVMRFKDAPSGEANVEADYGNKIMHIALPIGKSNILMGSDAPEHYETIPGTNIQISIDTESEDEATRLFNGLAAGGKITLALGKTFWGSFFGMLQDKYGINWMVSYNEQPQS